MLVFLFVYLIYFPPLTVGFFEFTYNTGTIEIQPLLCIFYLLSRMVDKLIIENGNQQESRITIE